MTILRNSTTKLKNPNPAFVEIYVLIKCVKI